MVVTFTWASIIVGLVTLYLAPISESKTINLKKGNVASNIPVEPFASDEYLNQMSEEVESVFQDYIIANLRKNTFKALRKLTQNWEIVSKRTGKQIGEETAISNVGQSLNIASTVIRSLVDILSKVFAAPLSRLNVQIRGDTGKRERVDIEKTTENPHFPIRDSRMSSSEYNDILTMADSLRFSTYADQLNGALNILVKLQDPHSQIKSETIKSTVDYVLDAYVITNGKTQALFLPELFEGIPKKT